MSSFIPESAPFSEEQRAWLNGFFSGLMGIQPGMAPGDVIAAAGITTDSIIPAEPEEEDHAWHDSALPIVDRMELAQGEPLERKLMAAMAQLDCGTCGYICQSYGEAIASGEETNLTLCSPGGKETKQMIKKLLKERGEAPTSDSPQPNGAAKQSNGAAKQSNGWSRQNPYSARLLESRVLNGEDSVKDTRHVVIDLDGSGLSYEVGDALGICPTNCRDLAMAIIERLAADPALTVEAQGGQKKSLVDAIVEDFCLKEPSDELIELLADRTQSESARAKLLEMHQEGVSEGVDVLDVIDLCENAPVTMTEVIETLAPLNPRLYSIASSMKHVGNSVHLTVGKVAFEREGRDRKGVASTLLAERLGTGDPVRVFVQPNHGGFTVPADSTAPMIMVGPGTGIAPFLAFLQERKACNCEGKNWLFFGDQHAASDFLYEEDLQGYVADGTLARLDTAFSRDGTRKVYVQDRMLENAAELWQWLEAGAYFFVCGDASRMAADVDKTLIDIIIRQGGLSAEEAKEYAKQLRKDKRYVRDVY